MPLRLWTRPGSKTFYIRGTVRGQGVYETAGTSDRAKAEMLRAKRETELYETAVWGARAVVSFQRAVLAFLEHEERSAKDQTYIAKLVAHFGSTPLAQIDQEAIDTAVLKLVGRTAAPATKVRAVYAPVMTILNFAARRKWCDVPKFDKPTLPKGKTRWIEPQEALRLIACAAPHLRPLLTFLLCTGARLSEALDMDWKDVDLPAAKVIFRDTKNGGDRIARLPPAAVVALATIPLDKDGKRNGRVFRRDDGEPYVSRKREAGGQIRTAFHSACERAGLSVWKFLGESVADGPYSAVERRWTLTPHDLRHTWATWFYGITKDLLLLKDEGGWRTTRMVERYSHLMQSELVPQIALVWGETHPRIGVLPRGAIGVQPISSSQKTA